jgi:hypothetical protein
LGDCVFCEVLLLTWWCQQRGIRMPNGDETRWADARPSPHAEHKLFPVMNGDGVTVNQSSL